MGKRLRHILVSTGLLISVSQAKATEVRIIHCLNGICPTRAAETNITAVHEIYALSSNAQTKIVDWVAYRPSRETTGTSKDLKRVWRSDPILPEGHTLEADGGGADDDYKWGHRENGYDRGHLAPLTLFADTKYWRSTNYYSNIVPMKSSLNQGPWKELEEWEHGKSYKDRSLFVLTGPLYDGRSACKAFQKDNRCLPNANEAHSIPTAYWKVITNRTGSQASAFIMPQEVERKTSPCEFYVSVGEVETASGLTLFPSRRARAQRRLDGRLGCTTTTAQQLPEGFNKG